MARLSAPPPPTSSPTPRGDGLLTSPTAPRATQPGGRVSPVLHPPEPPAPPPTRRDRLAVRADEVRRRAVAVPRRWLGAALVVLVLVAGGVGYWQTRPASPKPLTQADVDATVKKAQADAAKTAAAAPADASLAYQVIQPALVLITTQRPETATQSAETGVGAGVIVNADGTILTADHVVDGASSIIVSYTDGTKSKASIVTSKPESDTATIRPSTLPQTLVPATLGGSVVVGAPVFAVGHPLDLVDSLSAGVVSGLDRTVSVPGGRRLSHLIQIDAAVNPGNSGGPLLDKAGHVVGIVTGLANPDKDGSFAGIGFAVPIATAGGAAGSPPQ